MTIIKKGKVEKLKKIFFSFEKKKKKDRFNTYRHSLLLFQNIQILAILQA